MQGFPTGIKTILGDVLETTSILMFLTMFEKMETKFGLVYAIMHDKLVNLTIVFVFKKRNKLNLRKSKKIIFFLLRHGTTH